MGDEQKTADIGRAVQALKSAKINLAQLRVKASNTGEKLHVLANLLENNPELVWFDGASINTNYFDGRRAPKFVVGDIDGRVLAGLTTAIRDAMDELERCEQKARDLGC